MFKLFVILFLAYLFFKVVNRVVATMIGEQPGGVNFKPGREKDISDRAKIIKD